MQLSISTKRYVCFNNNGEIEKISRRVDENLNSIEVDIDEVISLMNGKESFTNYKVEYDFIDNKYVLKNIIQQQLDNTVGSFLYEIPSNESLAEITICQNLQKKCWQIILNDEYFNNLGKTPNLQNMFFSVTKKGDPNILYRLLKFTEDEIPFMYDLEFDKTSLSIYTVRKYSKYNYEVIDV
jgi:hypothetical protein